MLLSKKLTLKLSDKSCPKIELIILKQHLWSASLVFYPWAGLWQHDLYVSLSSDKHFIFVYPLVAFIISNIPVLCPVLIFLRLISPSIHQSIWNLYPNMIWSIFFLCLIVKFTDVFCSQPPSSSSQLWNILWNNKILIGRPAV